MRRRISAVLDRFASRSREGRHFDDKSFDKDYLRLICQPSTIIDVGVGYGTHSLYEAFPNSHLLLVEPLRDYAEALKEIENRYSCEVVYKAVSDFEGGAEFLVEASDLQKSSFSTRTCLTQTDGQKVRRLVEVTTLDTIMRDHPTICEPILLKLDTEGHELRALKGATQLMKRIDTIIAEVSIAPRFDDGYTFEQLLEFTGNNGFFLFTILNITRARGEARARFADVAFKRLRAH